MAVLIKGKSIQCARSSRDHYLRGKENERITVREVKGFFTKDPDEALRMIELSAKGTRCKKPLYSAKINPETDRIWNKDEIRHAIELLEENLGLKGHPRVVVEHKKGGRIHFHVLWSRFHSDGGPAKNMANDYAIHQKTQRHLAKEFKLRPMMAKGRDFKDSEVKWAQRLGFDIFEMREKITADFNGVTGGQQFKAKLEVQGIVLCRGDKSQFVLVLPWGQHKALSSMIHGRPRKAALRSAMADIDIPKLPTVSEGKATVKARLPKRQKQQSRIYRAIGQTFVKTTSRPIEAWKANKSLFAAYLSKPSPKVADSHEAVAQTRTESGQIQNATVAIHETLSIGKNVLFQPDITDEAEPISRSGLAYEEEFNKWTGLIEAAATDKSVPRSQRKANVAALRQRQLAAAKAASKRVREEEQSIASARRKARLALLGQPAHP